MNKIWRVRETALFLMLFFCGFFITHTARAYDNSVAHPGIAQMAAELYNSQNDPDLTEEEMAWIRQGAEEEDTPTRWFNHFYDPVYNTGFSDLSRLGIKNNNFSFTSANLWAQSPDKQTDFALGDNSWQRGLADYSEDDRQKAFVELGHAIHLISDMAVPAHTRNSEHVGDSYESFVKKNWLNIRQDLNSEIIKINNLNNIFGNLALDTNRNFYSDRTIEDEKYDVIEIKERIFVGKNNKTLFLDHKERSVYSSKGNYDWRSNEIEKDLDETLVLSSYSTRLIPKAIGASAGLIEYFISEGEKMKQEKQNISWWQKLWTSNLPLVRINAFGVLNQALGYVVELGENVVESLNEYNDQSPDYLTESEIEKILSEKSDFNQPVSTPTVISIVLNKENKPAKDESKNSIDPIVPELVMPVVPKEVLSEEENEVITTVPFSTTSTLTKHLSASAGFDPLVTIESPINETVTTTPTTTPTVEVLPPPIPDNIFSVINFVSSTRINIFGTVTSSALSVSAFYRPGFATETPWTELSSAMKVSSTLWQGIFDLTNKENSFIFYAANTATTSEFSSEARIFLDNTPPNIEFFDVTSTIATGTAQISGEFLFYDETDILYDLNYQRNSGDVVNIFSASTNTSFNIQVAQAGNYTFTLRACDILYNCAEYSTSTVVTEIPFDYIYLGGEQGEETLILTAEHSPYILSNYIVPTGKKLIIEPGVMIRSLPGGSLTVYGELLAFGEEDNRILFTTVKDQIYNSDILNTVTLSETDPNVFHDWNGIRFLDNASGTLHFAAFKNSGVTDFFNYRTYQAECSVSFAILSKGSKLELSHVEFNDAGRADVCAINSEVTISDSDLDGYTDQTETRPIFPGRVGVEAKGGILNMNRVNFRNYSYFPVYLNSSAVQNFSEVTYQDNLFNSAISLFYENNYRYIYQGDGFYIFQATLLNQSLLNTLDLVDNDKIYVMSTAYLSGDLILSGMVENKLEIILLSEYGGRMELDGNFNFANTEIKMNEPDILWFALSGLGMRGTPGTYGYAEGQLYSEFLSNHLSLNDYSNSEMIKINYGSSVNFENSLISMGPLPYQYVINSDNGNLSLVNSTMVWNYVEENSLSLRDRLRPAAIHIKHGNLSVDNTVFSGFYYGVYSDTDDQFYNGDMIIPDAPEDFPTISNWTGVSFDNISFPIFPDNLITNEMPSVVEELPPDGLPVIQPEVNGENV